ncbi:putative RNA polymerase II transcriptional coactivator [Aspergillus udagawae]|uniref:RNA polymerase II transcriptional coactivator n=1 Tax=Aspergillus udagawae TaxID=91492 RepID=A0ABQ1BCR5_9EURO|nr:putative RNA polymerase II transcriptional coactivator [Aspergillus udagawae]GFF98676.1 putative RNA polymerase II transcriptional coactivator [Aspergillus udagawae]GFG13969.1 putative RNA polymerase II transcriptional coactivator [Aspergillus udagawae]GFG25789.1 putative RNA polymerase II transcriptional coactivator [Aspergillus udagawae]
MPSGPRKRVSSVSDDRNNEYFQQKKAKIEASMSVSASSPHNMHKAVSWKVDANGDKFWELSKMRRVTISSFRGKTLVNIREYYEKDGQELPGKKGISLPIDQFSALVTLLPDIEMALKESGEFVPRPEYPQANEKANGDDSNETDQSAESESPYSMKKNIDATSEED